MANNLGNDVDTHYGEACISGRLVDKPCSDMSNDELAEFIEQGAWRCGRQESDESAYIEAASRLRRTDTWKRIKRYFGEDSQP